MDGPDDGEPQARESDHMKRIWAGGLGLSLGWFVAGASAEELNLQPVPVASVQPIARTSGVSLGRPMPLSAPAERPAMLDAHIVRASFQTAEIGPAVTPPRPEM